MMGVPVELGSRRVLHPGKLRWLRATGWMVLLFVLLVLAGGLVTFAGIRLGLALEGLAAATRPARDTPWEIGLPTIAAASLAVVAVYALAVRAGENRALPELSLRHLLPEWAAGAAVGAGLMALTIAMLWAAGWASVTPQPVTAIAKALQITIQSSIVEETIFRLVVFRLLWRGFGIWPALAVSALLFGGLHLTNPNATPFAALCIALEAGILLAAFYILTGRAWMSIGVHAGWNFTQGWVFGAAVSGTDGFVGGPLATAAKPGVAAMLSGGSFGPEASLPGLLICTAAGLLVLRRAWRQGQFVPAPDSAA